MKIFNNVLSDELFDNTLEMIKNLSYKFGWSSAGISIYDSFFNLKIVDVKSNNRRDITAQLPIPYDNLWQILQAHCMPKNTVLLRAYINLQVFGTEAHPHRDIDACYDEDESLVFYFVPQWKREWGGSTLEYNNDGSVEGATVARNRAVTFVSSKLHQALPLSKSCHLPRFALVFKARPPSDIEDYMISKNWDSLKHGNSNFAHHLMKAAHQAKLLGASEDVIEASRFHAVLGTPFFTPPDVATEEELVKFLSPYALELVKQFSKLNKETRLTATGDLSLMVEANEKSQNVRKKK